jgi:putative phage-type endonuclease
MTAEKPTANGNTPFETRAEAQKREQYKAQPTAATAREADIILHRVIAAAQSRHPRCVFPAAELPQGSPAWHEFRQRGVGASEVSALLGANPWQSAEELAALKRGDARAGEANEAMRRGSRLESLAREAFMAWVERDSATAYAVQPVCVVHPELRQMRASLDGLDHHGHLVEIKCPANPRVHADVYRNGPPPYYVPQLQQQLAIAHALWGTEEGWFVSFFPGFDYPEEQGEQSLEELAAATAEIDGVVMPRLIARLVTYDPTHDTRLQAAIRAFWEAL